MSYDGLCSECGAPVIDRKCTFGWCPSHARAGWAAIVQNAQDLAADMDAYRGPPGDAVSALCARLDRIRQEMRNPLYERSQLIKVWGRDDIDEIIDGPYSRLLNRLRDERDAQERAARLAKLEEARKHWRPVVVGGRDITEHVAAMYDVIVASIDWGSEFLDGDTIDSILTVADLARFQAPEDDAIVKKWRAQRAAKAAAGDGSEP